MKSLSELPERDKTDETQQFIGNNPVKLLANSPTEDVLVTPEHLLPQIDSISNSNDAWIKLEQLKEAYIKWISIGVQDLYEDTSWFKDSFPQCQQDDTFLAYLPNTSDPYAHGNYKTALSNYYKTKNYVTYGALNYTAGMDIRRGVLFPSANNEQYITLNQEVLHTGKQRLIYNGSNFNNVKAIISFPNMTSTIYGLYNQERGSFVNFDLTLLCPKLTSSNRGYLICGFYPGYNENFHLKVFLPALNTPLYYFFAGKDNGTALPIEFSDIKYLLNNLNKVPSNGLRDKDRALINISGQQSPNKITITLVDSGGTEYSKVLDSSTSTNSPNIIADIINNDVDLNTKVIAEVFNAEQMANNVLITSLPGYSIKSVVSSTSYFKISLYTKETETGGPLPIYCGVSSDYGENYTLPDGTTGWKPIDGVTTSYDTGVVNFASFINQFYLDSNFKWIINWSPTTHS